MFRPVSLGSLIAFATIIVLCSLSPVHAQGAGFGGAPELIKVNGDKVTVQSTNSPIIILMGIVKQMKVPYLFGATSSSPDQRPGVMSIDVRDLPIERVLSMICGSSTPDCIGRNKTAFTFLQRRRLPLPLRHRHLPSLR